MDDGAAAAPAPAGAMLARVKVQEEKGGWAMLTRTLVQAKTVLFSGTSTLIDVLEKAMEHLPANQHPLHSIDFTVGGSAFDMTGAAPIEPAHFGQPGMPLMMMNLNNYTGAVFTLKEPQEEASLLEGSGAAEADGGGDEVSTAGQEPGQQPAVAAERQVFAVFQKQVRKEVLALPKPRTSTTRSSDKVFNKIHSDWENAGLGFGTGTKGLTNSDGVHSENWWYKSLQQNRKGYGYSLLVALTELIDYIILPHIVQRLTVRGFVKKIPYDMKKFADLRSKAGRTRMADLAKNEEGELAETKRIVATELLGKVKRLESCLETGKW